MDTEEKQIVKIGEIIRDQLALLQNNHCSEINYLIYKVVSQQRQLEMIRKGLEMSISKNWTAAMKNLTANVNRIAGETPYAVSELERTAKNYHTKIPAPRQVYEDLKQAQNEFGRLEFNSNEQTLSVFTDPIELEGVYLGDFEVQLQIMKIAEMKNKGYLRVIALDPHPAASNDCVTHPHVSDECLCAGDAYLPMQTALAEGRICDFFMLVRSVLGTYNSSSPYVALSEWDGTVCYDCGYVACGDGVCYCEICDNSFCDECFSYCRCCDNSFCQGCLTSCPACEESCCQECLNTCSECEEQVCSSCIEDDLCPSCKQEMESQTDESETNQTKETKETEQQFAKKSPTPQTGTAILANGVGEVIVFPRQR